MKTNLHFSSYQQQRWNTREEQQDTFGHITKQMHKLEGIKITPILENYWNIRETGYNM
jgi:hypothetical protein